MYNVYTIHDKVAEEAGPVYSCKNNGVAIRRFQDIMESISVSNDDYRLLHLGTFDVETATLIAFGSPIEINTKIKLEDEDEPNL